MSYDVDLFCGERRTGPPVSVRRGGAVRELRAENCAANCALRTRTSTGNTSGIASAAALPTTKSARTCGRRISDASTYCRCALHRAAAHHAEQQEGAARRRRGGRRRAGGGRRQPQPPATTGSEGAGARCSEACRGSRRRCGAAGVLLLQIAALRLLPAACRACRSAARGVSDALLAAATARMNSRCDRWPSPLVSYCAKSALRLVPLESSSRKRATPAMRRRRSSQRERGHAAHVAYCARTRATAAPPRRRASEASAVADVDATFTAPSSRCTRVA